MYLSEATRNGFRYINIKYFVDEMVLLYVQRPTKHENTTLLTGLSVASEEMSAQNI